MTRLISTRLAFAAISMIVVSVIIFWAVEWLPGDTATRILGRNATEENLAMFRARLHLDEPAIVRYGHWLSGILRGDLGNSLVADRPVAEYVATRAGNTFILAAFALGLYVPLSILLGLLTAVLRGRAADHVVSVLVLIGTCVPEFVVGILLVAAFAVALPWFPPLALIDQAGGFLDLLHILFLPTVTLTAAMTAYAVRMMRENLIDVLESDYVRMATLRGLPRWRILLFHALPNALGPAINVTGLNAAWLIGGIVIVETIFNFPGLGRLLVDAIGLNDIPVVLAASLLMTSIYIIINLLADIAVSALNPRLRTA